jgi:hypothetical protein
MRRKNLEVCQAAEKLAGSGKMRDWKSIQEKLVEKGYHRAPDLLNSKKIRMVLDICCDQSAASRDNR